MDDVAAAFPLTELQEAYLVGASRLVELGGLRPTYYVELDVVGLDVARAERAVDLLIGQHEQLRTEVLAEGGQRVLPPEQVPPYRLPVADLTALNPSARQAALARTRARLSQPGVPPTGWPLFALEISRIRAHRVRAHIAMSLLLLDGRSMRQVLAEWRALYRDPDAPLVTAESTFREIRLAQIEARRGAGYAAHRQYWQRRLDDLPDAPRLPLARGLATIDPVRFTRRVCHLDAGEWDRFTAVVRQHRLLPTTALLHLYAETLAAWATDPRFCLNVLHQGWTATHPETVGVVGQFGATLPLEVATAGGFWDRARDTQARLWRDLEHADVSGVEISRDLAARRGRTPYAMLPYVFTSMLGEPLDAPGRAGPVCRAVHGSLHTPQVLLDNQVVDVDGGVDCVWDMVDEAYPAGLPELVFATYRKMVRDVLAGAEPDVVPAAHRQRVAELNATGAAVPAGRLEDCFLARADREPSAVAVLSNRTTMTYGELAAASQAVAGWLAGRGVRPGDVVPVIMTKGWEQVAGVLGVLRAGAAYCPIDATLPAGRIRALVDDVAARVALTCAATELDRLEVLDVRDWAALPDAPPIPRGAGTDLAYVIFTSGSTGRPKGVMVEHRAALNTVLDVNERLGLGTGDRVLGISSLSFDLSVWDVFGSLAAGAALVLPDPGERPDPLAWRELAERHGVTVWNSVPALAEMLVELAEARPGLARPPVRAFLLSGDWIPVGLPDRIRALWPDTRVVAMGGATEAAIWSNQYEVRRVDPAWRSIPYGVPLRNQTMRVLDDRLELRPPWAEGGIFIGGAGLARGYWGDPERTAERFVHHPVTGERLYRTGDVGRYRPDGVIEFLGRADRQVKIQGFRVEPGEIEATLRRHPGVQAAVVVVAGPAGGQRRLVALVVPRDGGDLDLAGFLGERLPHYLVPAEIRCVPELPLTANGKVDTAAALAARPDGEPPAPDGTDDPAMLRRLSAVWAEVTQRPAVGPDDDFFALGGTSLLALRLVNRLYAELGVDLPLGQVFETLTVRAMARRLAAGTASSACAVELSTTGDGPALVLFHPVGGSVSGYRELARRWPGPVRAFQSRALVDGVLPAGEDLAGMAAGYLAELRADGPLVLGGWSMGGVLAYEAGRQLAAAGREVDVLMIDSPAGGLPPPAAAADRHLDFLRDLASGRLPVTAATRVRQAPPAELDAVACAVAVGCDLLPAGTSVAAYTHLAAVQAHNAAVLARYRPAGGGGRVLLIAAEASRGLADGWRRAGVDPLVHMLPGDHYALLAPGPVTAIVRLATDWLAAQPASISSVASSAR